MGRNTGNNYRIGSVRSREQFPVNIGGGTTLYFKVNTKTDNLMSYSTHKYKGVAMAPDLRRK
ncbi:MAG: hypothetical protein QW478_03650 [Candidatus Micrarchaeaceae archaeon]